MRAARRGRHRQRPDHGRPRTPCSPPAAAQSPSARTDPSRGSAASFPPNRLHRAHGMRTASPLTPPTSAAPDGVTHPVLARSCDPPAVIGPRPASSAPWFHRRIAWRAARSVPCRTWPPCCSCPPMYAALGHRCTQPCRLPPAPSRTCPAGHGGHAPPCSSPCWNGSTAARSQISVSAWWKRWTSCWAPSRRTRSRTRNPPCSKPLRATSRGPRDRRSSTRAQSTVRASRWSWTKASTLARMIQGSNGLTK